MTNLKMSTFMFCRYNNNKWPNVVSKTSITTFF